MNDEIGDDFIDELTKDRKFSIDERYDFRVPKAKEIVSQHKTTQLGTPPSSEIAAESGDDPLIGKVVGNYKVIRELGRGGFGTVYEALDVKLDRPAALKFLRFPLDPEYRSLFVREAKVIANLSKHPSIVQIYAWGEHQGAYYFALEFLDESAERLVEQSPEGVPVPKALKIVADCAEGLHFAHEQGILHRDIKPANILIDRKTGHAKLCDFGLARFQSMGSGTHTSRVAGSPPYMSPEQVDSGNLSGRTDVYALGVTLYELLSGRLPIEGATHSEIIAKILAKKTVPLDERRPDLPGPIIDIVRRATAHNPDDRFRNADEMLHAIVAVLKRIDSSGSAKIESGRRQPASRGRIARIAAAVLLAAGLAYAAVAIALRDRSAGPASDGRDWPVAVAAARDDIETGNYRSAKERLEEILRTNPSDDIARFALGYAQLLSGELDAAVGSFSGVQATDLREEGMAAVAHEREGAAARAALEKAVQKIPHGYPGLLLASLDVVDQKYPEALARLEEVERANLWFNWQERDYLRMLGRVKLSLEDLDGARATFAMLPEGDAVASGYLALMERQRRIEQREELTKQIDDMVKIYESLDPSERGDRWTSRPFAMSVKSEGKPTPTAVLAHLSELLPLGLLNTVSSFQDPPLRLVDRELLDEFLAEQRLSQLSSDDERLVLMSIVGARLGATIEYKVIGGQDNVFVTVYDNERTTQVLKAAIPYTTFDTPDMIANQILVPLANRLRMDYPIQARLSSDGTTAKINVGSRVAVTPGMEFDIRLTSNAAPQPDMKVVATGQIGDGETIVDLVGFTADKLSGNQFYVREMQTE